jgi:hypothetical protein
MPGRTAASAAAGGRASAVWTAVTDGVLVRRSKEHGTRIRGWSPATSPHHAAAPVAAVTGRLRRSLAGVAGRHRPRGLGVR